jgi:hypothetical protein
MTLPDFEPNYLSRTIAILIASLAWVYLYYREAFWGLLQKKRKS